MPRRASSALTAFTVKPMTQASAAWLAIQDYDWGSRMECRELLASKRCTALAIDRLTVKVRQGLRGEWLRGIQEHRCWDTLGCLVGIEREAILESPDRTNRTTSAPCAPDTARRLRRWVWSSV